MNISYTGILAGSAAYGLGVLVLSAYIGRDKNNSFIGELKDRVLDKETMLVLCGVVGAMASGACLTKFAIETAGMDPIFLAGAAISGIAVEYMLGVHEIITEDLKDKEYCAAATLTPPIIGFNALVASAGGLALYGAAEGVKAYMVR